MDKELITVLLVEDNPGDVRLIQEMFAGTKNSFNIELANSLSKGVEVISTKEIKVVLLDLGLPDSQGIDTFMQMHKYCEAIPVVVLTGLDDETLGIKAVHEGAQDYLAKGQVDGGLLVRAINYAIERQKLIIKLKDANAKIKTLQGLLPICAACKKIRNNDDNSWTNIESYIRERSDAEFTHSMCPSCAHEYYPELYDSYGKLKSKK